MQDSIWRLEALRFFKSSEQAGYSEAQYVQKCHWFAIYHLFIASIDKNIIKHLCNNIDTYHVMGRQIRRGRHIEGKMQTIFSRI